MSIASAIQNAQAKVAAAYTAISNKGGTLPATQNLSNMPTAITSIPSGGSSTKYGVSIDNLLGDVNESGILQLPSNTSGDIIFSGVADINGYGLSYKFYNGWNLDGNVSFPDLISLSGHHCLHYTFGSDSTFNRMQIDSVSFPNLSSISGNYAMAYAFRYNSFDSVSFPELVTISGSYALEYAFDSCSNLTSISFPKLTTISGNSAMTRSFDSCINLTSVSFPELTTITSANAMSYTFSAPISGTTNLTTVSFPKLETIYQQYSDTTIFTGCFAYQKSLSSIYFPALKTTSFSTKTNQFNNMMQNTGTSTTHTIHFPSNLESTIQGLTGYPNFGGTSGYVVLAYDLPATE